MSLDTAAVAVITYKKCRCGGTGRHLGLKIPYPRGCTGPTPAPGTTSSAQSPPTSVSGNSQRLLPKTAFASLRLLSNPKPAGFGFGFSRFFSPAAPPFQIEPASLGFGFVFLRRILGKACGFAFQRFAFFIERIGGGT